MTCAQVRTLLAERSMGTLPASETTGVDRHIAWCAACRKEVGGSDAAAASLVYVLAPVEPPPELEGRVVAAVRSAVSARAPIEHRRGRMVVAATVAAMIAVAGLGFGAVMAGRAARFRDQALTSGAANRDSATEFRYLLRSMEFSDPRNSVEMGDLAPVVDGPGSGTALTLLAPSSQDMSIVTVSSLRLDPRRLPLEVSLAGRGPALIIGSIARLDSGGSATVAAQLATDLSGFDRVVVRDAQGTAILRGDLTGHPLHSPSPAP